MQLYQLLHLSCFARLESIWLNQSQSVLHLRDDILDQQQLACE